MLRTALIYIALLLLVWALFPLVAEITAATELNQLASQYVQKSTSDLNSQNVVTSIVVTFRGLDTLGEVAVLFLATTGVAFLIKRRQKHDPSQIRKASEILNAGALFVFPIIILFGVYLFLHGHLTPGGGFQGGVLIASAFVLMMLSDMNASLNHLVLETVESISGFAYVLVGLLGLVLLGAFLDPTFLPLGQYGLLFSAGAIPLIYTFVGLKVGSELTNIVDSLREEQTEV
ncbi:MAG: hydrogen gas-evolving membrane-bound hydrogenase subunit E [Candidatus Cloacimonadales bacterium]